MRASYQIYIPYYVNKELSSLFENDENLVFFFSRSVDKLVHRLVNVLLQGGFAFIQESYGHKYSFYCL